MATENIGVPIDLSAGNFMNTEIGANGLQLKYNRQTYDKISNVYADYGVWISDSIDLVDKYTSLENLAITSIVNGLSSYKSYTRTSDDNFTWDNYIEIDSTGKMMSVPRRFIQIKIEFFGGLQDKTEVVDDFVDPLDFESNEYIGFDGSNLQLKRNYKYEQSIDSTWTESGNVFRRTIDKSKFKKIDSIRIISGK